MNKEQFLLMITQQGIKEIKKKIASSEVAQDQIVTVANKVKTAKASIGEKALTLHITDEDLEEVVIQVAHGCGLKTDHDDEKVVLNPLEKAQLGIMTSQAKGNFFIETLKGELTNMARRDIKNGKLDPSKPYDLEPNAKRLIGAWRKNFITGVTLKKMKITDDELKQMMKEVLVEVGFKEIKE